MYQLSRWRSHVRLALATLPAAVVFASAFAQQPAAPPPQTANMTGGGGFVDSSDLRVSRIRFEPGDMIVIGESMGAARAELLATKFPEKYSRLVLVGSPQTPSARTLKGAKAIATLAGENEQQTQMKAGTRALEGSGTPTRFWELPDATHGNYGPDGERIMNEAITFVASR